MDHAMTRSRHACWVTDVDTKTLAECDSDHRLVQVTVNPARGRGGHVRRGLRRAAGAPSAQRHAVDKLRDTETQRAYAAAVTARLEGVTPASQRPEQIDGVERELVGAVRTAADAVLGHVPRARQLGWRAEHASTIRDMAAARRKAASHAGQTEEQRKAAMKELRRTQQRDIRGLIAQWRDKRLQEVHADGLPSKQKLERVEREAGLGAKQRGGGELLAKGRTPLCGHDARLARWREHFAELFAEESDADLAYIRRDVPQRKTQVHLDEAPSRAEYSSK